MSYLSHIEACNAYDPAKFQPFFIGDIRYGWLTAAVADVLLSLSGDFERADEGLRISPRLATFDARTDAFDRAAVSIVDAGLATKIRTEHYGVKNRWADDAVAAVNRGAVPSFGLRSYGVHLNGWLRRADGGINIWVGRRAMDKSVAPGKLDNMVAGGQPHGLTLMDNLVKEAAEEASVPETLARRARPVGGISYVMEHRAGLRDDVMFCYDIEMPAEFIPVNADGETQDFQLMAAEDVAARVRTSDDFKFNVNLAMTDFLIRHGVIDPDSEPDYAAIVQGLRAPG